MSLPAKFPRPVLCYVTDRHSLTLSPEIDSSHWLLQVIETAAAAGVDWIQIREKDLSDRDLAWLTQEALRRTAWLTGSERKSPRIIVNDRLNVVIEERAGGAHLGESRLPLKKIHQALDENSSAQPSESRPIIGVSCHSLQTAISAAGDHADYLIFGPIFSTPSKAIFGPPQGLDRLAEVCGSVKIPVLAVGGITLENAASCLAAGAAGLAAIRLFQDATDLPRVVRALRNLAV